MTYTPTLLDYTAPDADTLPEAAAKINTNLGDIETELAAAGGGGFDYVKTALTGGGGDALDGIDGNDLSGGERALVAVGDDPATIYMYVLDATSGLSESVPNAIEPDLNPGTKVWVLAGNVQRIHVGSADPTADDDDTEGYRTGDLWTYDATAWICADASSAAAVWLPILVLGTSAGTAAEGTHAAAAAPHSGHEATANKGTASGYAGLDANGEVPVSQLPEGASTFDYIRTALTGGGAGALDEIDGADLSGGERAVVAVGNNPATVYLYVLDEDSGLSETEPNVIVPDTNPGSKAWILTGNTQRLHAGAAAPTVNDDSGDGYRPLDLWEYDGAAWICVDNTSTAAVWLPILVLGTSAGTAAEGTHAAAAAPHSGHATLSGGLLSRDEARSGVESIAFDQSTSSPATIFTPEDNMRILQVQVDVTTAAGGSGASVTVGHSGDADADFEATDADLETAGLYEVHSMRDVGASPNAIALTITAGGQTFAGRVYVYWKA